MLHFLMVFLATLPIASAAALPGCPTSCGGVDIPYPFGIGLGCYYPTGGFGVSCDNRTGSPKPFFGGFGLERVMLETNQVRVNMPAGQYCFTPNGQPRTDVLRADANLTLSPFTISAVRNAFTAIGCDTLVRVGDGGIGGFMTGCVSVCTATSQVVNGSCAGIGCCQTPIPEGLSYFEMVFSTFSNYSGIRRFSRCSYAFVVEKEAFEFNTTILTTEYNYGDLRPPMILDWGMENKTCAVAKTNITSYACRSANSVCVDSNSRHGYVCNCSSGYEGNPYLDNGCTDIDECKKPEVYPCRGICSNRQGGYNCACPPGTKADNPKQDQCIPDGGRRNLPLAVKVLIGVGSGVLFFMVIGSWAYWGWQKRRLIKLKQAFFEQNGGLFLQQQLSYHHVSSFKIFNMQDMQKATSNFDQSEVIGKGGHGMVYRGTLEDGRVVAIKKSLLVSESKSKEFAKEMFILSQINHVSIVKLLGCCLEAEVPMLVYEYIPNGTLFQFIHGDSKASRDMRWFVISLEARLRIATEAAEALAYLHSAASPPILHGDVKSSNILLDNNYRAKVSDFGTSVLALDDRTQFTTLVQGTCGYLDPEYLQTCQLTEKSDVYSFGVVLVELLTTRKALHFGGTDEERSLAFNFVSCANENRVAEILDPQIMDEEGLSKQLLDVVGLAVQCLSIRGDERPTMKEVAAHLQSLRKSDPHPWVKKDEHPEETESLLVEPVYGYGDASCSLSVALDNHPMFDSGR